MICSKCQKRPAVVFVSSNKDDQQPRGYCLMCAKELGIKPVEDIIKKMGISPEELETVQEQMDSIMENMGDMGDMSQIAENMGLQNTDADASANDENEEEDGFTPGGAPSFPNFFNMFGANNAAQNNAKNGEKKGKEKRQQKNRKHIGLYCEDLTKKARSGNIDNVIGREKEIERVIQILSRRTKNNPCLIGEPGVGKTAIAEGLALRIAQGKVPHRLKDKEIQLLDLTALIAGTQFRGQYESRIKGLMKEVKEAGNIILFIDEVHNLVGGGDSEGTMNAANILKPALSRGEIQVIGVRLPDKKALFKKGLEVAAETAGIGPGSWQLQRAGSVEGTGEEISGTGYDASAWLPAVVPGTVLTSYVEAGVVPDPGVADNIQQISESFFNSDFWYRGTVPVPTDSLRPRTILNLDGINWKAEVFMNGHRLGDMAGAFIRGRFDVTELLDTTGNAIIAIHVIKNANYGAVKEKNAESPDFNGGILGADNPTFHATVGWDWIPTVRGREVGIWNDVRFTNAKDVVLDNPMVQSRISQPDTLATMTFSVDVTNLSDGPVRGTVAGSMDSLMFSKAVALMPGETRTVTISPSDCPELMNRQVALWWPNGYGEQALHDATFTFVAEGDTLDTANPDLCWKAGIREITWSGERTSLNLYVNGHRFLPKGGNWGFSEYLLRYGADEYDKAVSYHKEMNLNMIRNWVGQTGDEEFYDACDKYGILVWQDFWLANPTDGPDPDDEDMFIANAEDYVKLIRRHPSIGMYCGRNEGYPPVTLNARLVQTVGKYHPGMLYIPSSADDGVSGHGPYRAVEPDTYFSMPALKFHTERGMPAIMNIGSLTATLGEDHLSGRHRIPRDGQPPVRRGSA